MVDLTITFPSIRLSNLPKVCNAIKMACSKHTFEIIIASPYNQPPGLEQYNIKWIKTYAAPTICWQMASILSNSEFLVDGSDDALFQEGVLDEAIDAYKASNLGQYDLISLHLKEGTLDPESLELLPNADTSPLRPEFFMVAYNPPFYKACIPREWKLSLNFLVKTKTFLDMGGFETKFQYINHSLHDYVFRIQSLGGQIYDFGRPALMVSHLPDESGDHGPVHRAQKGHDTDKFNEIYDNLTRVSDRAFLDINAWKNEPQWWEERFGCNTQ